MASEATLWQRIVARFSQTAADIPLPLDKLSCSRLASGEGPRQPVVLLGCGSFNPPTIAHLRMFELARDHLAQRGCDVLGGYMSPVNDAYRKEGLAPAQHRVAMAQAAVESSPFVMVDGWEAVQPSYQRSLTVLQRVQSNLRASFAGASPEQRPVRVMLLCGADLVESFAKPGVWKPEHLREILQEHGVVCISRGAAETAEALPAELREGIEFVQEPVANDISSSALRGLLAEGRSVKYLTPDPVIEYIRRHRLYGQ